MTNLIIKTAKLDAELVEKLIEEGYLPVFIERELTPSTYQYFGTDQHFPELSPSYELREEYDKGLISEGEFEKKYLIELASHNWPSLIRNLEILRDAREKGAIVIISSEDCSKAGCHRIYLSEMLSCSGLLNPNSRIKEIE